MRAKDYLIVPAELDHDNKGQDTSRHLQVAVTAILCEMAHVDDYLSQEEFESVIRQLVHQFHLMDDEAEKLREIALVLIKDKAKVDEFIDEINESFDIAQRRKVFTMALEVAQADKTLDAHEKFFGNYLRERLAID